MKTKEIFRELFILAVRLAGLMMIYHGVMILAISHPLADSLFSAAIFFAGAFFFFKGPLIKWSLSDAVAETSPAPEAGGDTANKPMPDST